ncbi:MAG: group 1 truncated hemoglobin [Acidobacteriia bacterium]|nr:group 1 truncated hemoglobin [Terriglobia bacterium]
MLDPTPSLYRRLGGYDAIAAFVDDLLPRLTSDPQIGVYWKGKCTDSMRKHRQLVVDFLSFATGGPVDYRGLDMKTSHDGLRISESDWNVFVKHAVATLDDLGVAEPEKSDVLAVAGSFVGDIVEAPQSAGSRA